MLAADRLREVLDYDPETGLWRWKILLSKRCYKGWFSGHKKKNGYLDIRIDGVPYYVQRLAFLWMTGKWPAPDADHKDRDRANNKWDNLREATRAQNMANTLPTHPLSNTGYKGIRLKLNGRYVARVVVDGKQCTLGTFDTLEEALVCRKAAWEILYGEYARVE